MKEINFYKLATAALLVLNVGVLAFLVLNRGNQGPPPMREGSPFAGSAIEVLDLNKEQAKEFHQLAQAHGELMRSLDEQKSGLLLEYFGDLGATADSQEKNVLLDQILALESDKIKGTYSHFEDIQTLSAANADADMDKFLQDAMRMILRSGPKHHGPRRPR